MIKLKNLLSKSLTYLLSTLMLLIVAAVLDLAALQYTPAQAYTMISAKFETKAIQMAEAR